MDFGVWGFAPGRSIPELALPGYALALAAGFVDLPALAKGSTETLARLGQRVSYPGLGNLNPA